MRSTLAVIVLCCAVFGGCASTGSSSPRTVEFGVVPSQQPPLAGPTLSLPYFGSSREPGELVELQAPLLSARVKSAALAPDELGFPAVTGELDDRDKQRFEDFTANHIGEEMVVVVRGQAIARATINTRLPGQFLLDGRYNDAEAATLLKMLE